MADKEPTSATPNPDLDRPEQKARERKPRNRGPKPEPMREITVVSGRDMIMGLDPTKQRNQYLFYNIDDIIRLKGGFTEYKKMRHDDAVKAAMAFKKILVYCRQWDIDTATKNVVGIDVAPTRAR